MIPAIYAGLLDKLLAALEWEEAQSRARAPARRRRGGRRGLCHVRGESGLGPADGVRIEVDNTGRVELITGGASIGTGF